MSIYEQLINYCGCDCGSDTETTEENVNELINLISNATCWSGDGVCSTFLMSDRKEVLDLPSCPDKCFVYEYKPFYHPYVVESFSLTIIEQQGITESVIPLTSSDFIYSETDGMFKIKLPYAEDCKCRSKCECEKKYKFVATYEAGYEELPDCLLPIFCEMLDLINKKNECGCCTCDSCNDEPNTENQTNYGKYTEGDAMTFEIVNNFGPILINQYKSQLGLISLCEEVTLWGTVL